MGPRNYNNYFYKMARVYINDISNLICSYI